MFSWDEKHEPLIYRNEPYSSRRVQASRVRVSLPAPCVAVAATCLSRMLCVVAAQRVPNGARHKDDKPEKEYVRIKIRAEGSMIPNFSIVVPELQASEQGDRPVHMFAFAVEGPTLFQKSCTGVAIVTQLAFAADPQVSWRPGLICGPLEARGMSLPQCVMSP